MDLSIIIVNWNSKNYVRKCLQSVYANTHGLSFEILVVDGASFDGCGEMLANEFPEVKFIQCEQNVGFARANNLGFRHAQGECILFLNPDTELVGPAIQILHSVLMTLNDAGAVGARLWNTDMTLQASCIQAFPTVLNQMLDSDLLRRLFPRARLWGMSPLFSQSMEPSPVEGISGACILTRRSVFEAVGGFSEDFFMYYEDMDYCLKASKIDLKNYYVPSASVVHHGGGSSRHATSRFSGIMMVESAWRFFCKAHGRHRANLLRFGLALKALSRLCLLALVCPFIWPAHSRHRLSDAIGKWASIFSWAIGTENIIAGNYKARFAK
jgi:GT2 family glycosyltransferase